MMLKKYIRALRSAGKPVSASLVLAAPEGIVTAYDRTLLAENDGYIAMTRGWADSLLKRMGFVKRKATTKTSVLSDIPITNEDAVFCNKFLEW